MTRSVRRRTPCRHRRTPWAPFPRDSKRCTAGNTTPACTPASPCPARSPYPTAPASVEILPSRSPHARSASALTRATLRSGVSHLRTTAFAAPRLSQTGGKYSRENTAPAPRFPRLHWARDAVARSRRWIHRGDFEIKGGCRPSPGKGKERSTGRSSPTQRWREAPHPSEGH